MNKPESIESWLEQLGQPSADRDYKPGHARMLDLLEPLHLQRPKLRIRIAGTNGKGSTAFMLAAALRACGLKVGLYTSPHILKFNERIRMGGIEITDEELTGLMERLMPQALKIGASYFEVATALALAHFSNANVDAEILEAGVGARLDATTAVEADVALITPIALDHQNWLGDTLEQIALEKAYAMQECNISISAPQAGEAEAILCDFAPKMQIAEIEDWPNLSTPGSHQQINASLAMSAIKAMIDHGMLKCSPDRAKQAIEATVVPGRLQKVIYDKSNVWIDAAHNRHAVEALLPTLKEMSLDTIIVFTREDRSLVDSLELLSDCADRVITDADYANVTDALNAELQPHTNGRFLILGSFITVAAAIKHLQPR